MSEEPDQILYDDEAAVCEPGMVDDARCSGEDHAVDLAAEGSESSFARQDSCMMDGFKADDGEDCQTLYIRNLPPNYRSEDIRQEFSKFGAIVDCRVVINPVTKDSRGFGFVQFKTVAMAELAQEKMDGMEIRGKPIRIEKARRNRPHDPTPGEYKGPTGASIKYDNRGRLKPGYAPYWSLPFPKHMSNRSSPMMLPSRMSYRRSASREMYYRDDNRPAVRQDRPRYPPGWAARYADPRRAPRTSDAFRPSPSRYHRRGVARYPEQEMPRGYAMDFDRHERRPAVSAYPPVSRGGRSRSPPSMRGAYGYRRSSQSPPSPVQRPYDVNRYQEGPVRASVSERMSDHPRQYDAYRVPYDSYRVPANPRANERYASQAEPVPKVGEGKQFQTAYGHRAREDRPVPMDRRTPAVHMATGRRPSIPLEQARYGREQR